MFLQATVDAGNLAEAHRMIDGYAPHISNIDYIEIGAPLITHFGTSIVRTFTVSGVPLNKIYADLKMIDFPKMEATPWIEEGITRISAMAVMNDGAFEILRDMMDQYNLTVFISTMGYPLDRVWHRVYQLAHMGFQYFICHGAGASAPEAFTNLIQYSDALLNRDANIKLIGAGGITEKNADQLRSYAFAGLIVGRGLLGTVNVSETVKTIKSAAAG